MAQTPDDWRSTVVAAVDGMAGRPEFEFLLAAYQLRDILFVYDPVLNIDPIRGYFNTNHIPASQVMLTRGSLTGFGHWMPEAEFLIPHPGPWSLAEGPDGLAGCIEEVLGTGSRAYVLTDNESLTGEKKQSTKLVSNLQAINASRAKDSGFTPLTWTITTPDITTDQSGNRFTVLGGARMQIRHDPPYKLITISR